MNASQILSRLNIKGATSAGGDAKYADFLLKLDANGQIPLTSIPAISITSVTVVADKDARLALTNVQVGDVVKQLDTKQTYILAQGTGAEDTDWLILNDDSTLDLSTYAGDIGNADTGASNIYANNYYGSGAHLTSIPNIFNQTLNTGDGPYFYSLGLDDNGNFGFGGSTWYLDRQGFCTNSGYALTMGHPELGSSSFYYFDDADGHKLKGDGTGLTGVAHLVELTSSSYQPTEETVPAVIYADYINPNTTYTYLHDDPVHGRVYIGPGAELLVPNVDYTVGEFYAGDFQEDGSNIPLTGTDGSTNALVYSSTGLGVYTLGGDALDARVLSWDYLNNTQKAAVRDELGITIYNQSLNTTDSPAFTGFSIHPVNSPITSWNADIYGVYGGADNHGPLICFTGYNDQNGNNVYFPYWFDSDDGWKLKGDGSGLVNTPISLNPDADYTLNAPSAETPGTDKLYYITPGGADITFKFNAAIKTPSDSGYDNSVGKVMTNGKLYIVKLQYSGDFWMLISMVGGY